MKKHIFYSFILLLLLTATIVQAQEYTNDTLWQASVGGTITDIFFSPDDKYLVVVGYRDFDNEYYPRFYNALTGEIEFEIKEAGNSYFGDFSPDGKYYICATGHFADHFSVYDIENREIIRSIPSEKDNWSVGTFANNGNQVWMTTFKDIYHDDYKIVVYDTETWEKIHEMQSTHVSLIKSSQDGRYVALRYDDYIGVVNSETYKLVNGFEMPESVNDFAFSPDGTMIAGTSNTALIIWNIESGKTIKEIIIEDIYLFAKTCFSNDSKYLVFGYIQKSPGSDPIGGTLAYSIHNSNYVNEYHFLAFNGLSITGNTNNIALASSAGLIVYYAKWGETSVSDIPEEENIIYPNPATGIVNILLDINKSETIDVNIYDTSGNIITNIFNGIAEPGTILTWNSSENPSGTYYCKVESRSFNRTYKIIVSK